MEPTDWPKIIEGIIRAEVRTFKPDVLPPVRAIVCTAIGGILVLPDRLGTDEDKDAFAEAILNVLRMTEPLALVMITECFIKKVETKHPATLQAYATGQLRPSQATDRIEALFIAVEYPDHMEHRAWKIRRQGKRFDGLTRMDFNLITTPDQMPLECRFMNMLRRAKDGE